MYVTFLSRTEITILQRPEYLNYNSSCERIICNSVHKHYSEILTPDLGERAVLCLVFVCVRLPLFTSWRLRTTHACGDTTNTTAQAQVTYSTIVSFPACVPRGPSSRRSGCGRHSEGTDWGCWPTSGFPHSHLIAEVAIVTSNEVKTQRLITFLKELIVF
jgi:hypothetical protein